jgi:hypothetical protein
MAISIGLLTAGLQLITLILKKIWHAEGKKDSSGNKKHNFVKGYARSLLKAEGIKIDDIDGFISDIVAIMNKYKIFTKKGD